MENLKFGIQLFSVKNALGSDPVGALKSVADAGYKYIEAANHNALTDDGIGFGISAKELRKHLDDNGLTMAGCHLWPLDVDRLPYILEYQSELGGKQVGCAMEVFPYNDLEYMNNICEKFNKIGKVCKEHGMRYYYHNHYEEFQKFPCFGGDKTVYDFIMEHTDPELVFAELDTYWAYRGGFDAVKLIEKYSDRIIMLHQKDFSKTAPQPLCIYDGIVAPDAEINMETFGAHNDPLCYTEIGTGTLPIKDILAAAKKAPNIEYVLLEQDATQLDELESIRVSMEGFKRLSE